MKKPVAISIKDVSKAARDSVSKAIDKHKLIKNPAESVGFFPRPPYWIGYVVYAGDDNTIGLADAQKLAIEVHRGIAATVPAMKGGKPGTIFVDGHLTIGFLPPIDIDVLVD